MNPSARLDQDDPGFADPGAVSSPIVIVQRGRPTWGRELLLMLLLIATVGYIFYQEYRGPEIIVRSESSGPARSVDAVPVPPLASGGGVQGAIPSVPNDEEPTAPSISGQATRPDREVAPPETPPQAVTALGDDSEPEPEPDEMQEEPLPPDHSLAMAGDDQSTIDGPSPFDESSVEADHPEIEEEAPRRSTHEIVWDLDRRARPPIDPAPTEDEPVASRRPLAPTDTEPAPPMQREPAPQTIAERRYFQQCLALAIRRYGRDAGPHIQGLCRDFRIPLPSEVIQLEQRYGSNLFVQGADLERTVTALRSIGAPESYLLDQLYEQMTRTIGVRRGPRNPMEARVYAARKLLAIPLPTPDADGEPITQ